MTEHKIKFFRKSVFIFLILLIQTALIYAYYTKENFLSNFKWGYLSEVYLPAYQYRLEHSLNLISRGGISQSRAEDHNASNQTSPPKQKAIPVFLYHGVIEREDGSNIPIKNFRDQMMALKKAGYQTVTLNDFYEFIQEKKELPEKSFLLTFDDGRKDSYYPVDPILKALDYNAVMYVITRYINSQNDHFYLSHQELKKMLDSGRWELQAHTKDGHDMISIGPNDQKGHYYSNKIWEFGVGFESSQQYKERVFKDLVDAKNDLEKEFGINVFSFAFPFGDFGQNSINFPKSKEILLDITQYAYPVSFYQVTIGNGFMYNYPGENDHLFKRINIRPEWSGDDLLAILKSGQAKSLPFEDDFSSPKGWFGSSGRNEITDLGLSLKSPADSQSGTLFLDGSRNWKNYSYNSLLNWKKGNKLSLLVSYKSNSDYLSCEISGQYIQLVSEHAGENKLLNEIQIPQDIDKNNLEVNIRIEGNKFSCRVNDKYFVDFNGIRPEQALGGVGIRTSDINSGGGEIIMKKVRVDGLSSAPDPELILFENTDKNKIKEPEIYKNFYEFIGKVLSKQK